MGKIFDRGGQFILDRLPDPTTGVRDWAPPGSVISTAERNVALDNYWGGLDRKYFPISDHSLLDLIYESRRYGKIMLCVENIEKPDSVNIKWLPYDKSIMNAADDYYIVESSFLNGNNPADVPNGIMGAVGDIIVATIGEKNDDHLIIINRASITLTDDPGGGGNPPGSGAQIPST